MESAAQGFVPDAIAVEGIVVVWSMAETKPKIPIMREPRMSNFILCSVEMLNIPGREKRPKFPLIVQIGGGDHSRSRNLATLFRLMLGSL